MKLRKLKSYSIRHYDTNEVEKEKRKYGKKQPLFTKL